MGWTLQGTQLKRFLPFAVIAACFTWSSNIGGVKFIPIYEALTIKAQKNSPAYVAFEELVENKKPNSEWDVFAKKTASLLEAGKSSAPLFTQKVVLAEMVLRKSPEPIPAANSPIGRMVAQENLPQENDNAWIAQLPPKEQQRVREAQYRTEVLNQNWQEPTFSERAKEVLEKSGVLVGTNINVAPTNKVYVASTDNYGRTRTEPSRPHVDIPNRSGVNPATDNGATSILGQKSFVGGADEQATGSRRIVGPIEITGGLAITNEHHIEIRRNDEGVLKELGRVDLVQGTYNIDVEEASGSVVAKLVDKDGKTLGEGSFRLNVVASNNGNYLQGPKLKVLPRTDIAGVVNDFYNTRANDMAPSQTRVTLIKGVTDVAVKKDGAVSMDNVTRGSTTVMRAAAPKHLQTAQIVVSGQEFRSNLYPNSMIQAMQDIVSQQRAMSIEGEPTIVWGRVILDGKNVSGIDVSIESDPGAQAIYFNQFMIPDPTLKATSENGLFAFVGVTPGFQSLLATRGESIFGYSNVVVEEGSVAVGDIEATIKSEPVPLKVYDAFTGEPKAATITMQSLVEELQVENGARSLMLPHINRLGLMRVHPESADYLPARYIYNDADEFIHVPLVQFNWLSAIKAFLKIDDTATSGFVVGFVPDEDFEVYIAGYDDFNTRNIVYFDMQGRILQNRKGMGGGGFIIYNVPEDTHEVVVLGARSQKIYSRVVPVDANSLSVLTFRE